MLWSVIRFLHAWKRYGSAVQELSSLNDRELADIGITRSDIPRLAWEHAKAESYRTSAPNPAPASCGRWLFGDPLRCRLHAFGLDDRPGMRPGQELDQRARPVLG